jgi:hypothetical protein
MHVRAFNYKIQLVTQSFHHIPMSLMAYLPTSSSLINNRVQDVTGQVVKTETYSFAFGGNSDIWKGLLSEKDSGNTTEVQTYFCLLVGIF